MSIAEKLQTIAENEQRVYDAGKKAEYDAFWDSYQENGNRTNYEYSFSGLGWNDETFKPQYDIKISQSTHMFSGCGITDLVGLLERCGVSFDTSKSIGTSYVATNSTTITTFPSYDCRNRSHMNYFITNCPKLRSIGTLTLKDDGSQAFTLNTLNGNTNLEEIRFEGVIGQNGLDLHWSKKLSKASIESIINHLSTTTSGLTVTLSQEAVNNAFTAEEWAALIATRTNWTISLV